MCVCSHGFDLNQLSTPQLASSSSCQQHGVWSVLRPVPSSVCRTASTTLCIWCQWGSQLVPSVLQSQSVAQPGKKKLQTQLFVCFPFWTWTWNVLSIKNDNFLRIFIINVHHFIWMHSLHMCNAQSGGKKATQRAFINTCFFQGLIPFSGQPLDTLVVHKNEKYAGSLLCPCTVSTYSHLSKIVHK